MKVLDLHVPANIILAASILLRMKSETFKVFDIPEPVEDTAELPGEPRIIPDVQPLVPRLRLQPNRHVTLYELMSALDEVMKMKEKRELFIQASSTPMQFYINEEDIDQKIEIIYNLVQARADKTGMTTFAYLSSNFDHSEKILLDLFVPLLFLAHKQRIIIMQEKFFDEILIKVSGGKEHG
jgi:chromatin segregation and condensation protein Rec8/ScpA/Scc1 (kleisin family)